MSTLNIHGRTITLTDLCRVVYPGEGILKGDVVAYYERIAPTMLPHVRDRIVAMHRFPEGIRGPDVHERDVGSDVPAWIRTCETEDVGRSRQVVVDEPATLAFLAQRGCVTPHPWLSRANDPHRPDRLLFVLDAPEDGADGWSAARHAARLLRSVLADVGLVPFVMTSGASGFHVHVPVYPELDFAEAKRFARGVAERCARIDRSLVTSAIRRSERAGRVFVDYLRNDHGHAAVAPYGLRARPGAPVATPLRWEELEDPTLTARTITRAKVFHRLARGGDPWRDMASASRSLREARTRGRRVRGTSGAWRRGAGRSPGTKAAPSRG